MKQKLRSYAISSLVCFICVMLAPSLEWLAKIAIVTLLVQFMLWTDMAVHRFGDGLNREADEHHS